MGQGVEPRGTAQLFRGGDVKKGEGQFHTVGVVGGGVVCWQRGGTASLHMRIVGFSLKLLLGKWVGLLFGR